ncbi:hypothetical protein BpHYR1_018319 [Brachionus plicatilis]|uniref:Uncharacterized protein n=1 Tax=Brachionus plicatilis TaxID=10195 RepID=A0A3M7PKB3_BRAPC|nr:hypothetical protein BpHYR1_018319 [Brachionus plicatilis]
MSSDCFCSDSKHFKWCLKFNFSCNKLASGGNKIKRNYGLCGPGNKALLKI